MVRDETLWKNHNTGEYEPILDISDFASPTGFDPSDFWNENISASDNFSIQDNLANRNFLSLGNGDGESLVNNPDRIADIALGYLSESNPTLKNLALSFGHDPYKQNNVIGTRLNIPNKHFLLGSPNGDVIYTQGIWLLTNIRVLIYMLGTVTKRRKNGKIY